MITFKELQDIKVRALDQHSDMIRIVKELERLRGCLVRIENLRMDCPDIPDAGKVEIAENIAREGLGV